MFPIIMTMVEGVFDIYLYCYFGKLATDSYMKMADCLYQSNWHILPIELQKYMILMINNMQQPLHYYGFGISLLNLETFIKVRIEIHRNGLSQTNSDIYREFIIYSICEQFLHTI